MFSQAARYQLNQPFHQKKIVGARISILKTENLSPLLLSREASSVAPSEEGGATKLSRDFRGGGRSLEGESMGARIVST